MDRHSEDREIIRDPEVMARMAATDDLFRSALLMIRQNVLRRNPEAGEEEIDDAIHAWLSKCPRRGWEQVPAS